MSLLLFAVVCLAGAALLGAAARRPLGLVAWVALPAALGILATGTLGVLLASAGRFTPATLAGATAALVLPCAVYAVRRRPLRAHVRRVRLEASRGAREHAALAALLLATLAVYERPSEWVVADGTDAANYVVQAAHEARAGSAFLDESPPESMRALYPRAVHRVNSTSGVPTDGMRRELPFPPLFKTVLAIAILGGGIEGALYVPLVLGLLAGLVAHVAFVRIARTRAHALVGTALLLLSPLLLKSLRVTLAEVCLLLVAVTGLALLEGAAHAGGRGLAVLAGLVLGLAPLTRVDGLLLYAGGVLMIVAGGIPRAAGRRDVTRWFAAAFLAGSALSWHLAAYVTHAYLDGQLRGHAAAVGRLLLAAPLAWALAEALGLRASPRTRGALGYAAALVFALQAAQALAVRPALRYLHAPDAFVGGLRTSGGPGLATFAYATVATTLLGAGGAVLALAGRSSRFRAWVCLFLVAAVVYLDDLHHSPDPFWASRRLLASVLPLLVAGALCALELRPFTTAGLHPQPVVVLALLANLAAHDARLTVGRGIFYVGAERSFAALAASFASSDLILVDGAHPFAAPLQLGLRYQYGLDARAPYLDSLDDDDLRALFAGAARGARRIAFVAGSSAAEARLRRLFALEEHAQPLRFRHLTGGTSEAAGVDLRWLSPKPDVRADARSR
jgi:hypothetical protein